MESKKRKADNLLALGITAMAAVMITMISDLILLGRPDSAYSFFKLGTESMANMEQWRITAGVFIGVVALPFQIAGLISVYYGLKPAGRIIPTVVVITNAHALIMGVAFHVSYAYIGSGWKIYYEAGSDNIFVSEIIKRFGIYWKITIVIMLAEILFSSVLYALIILQGNTLYPKWMAVMNPLCVILVMLPVILSIPSPVGGFIAPTYLNISTMLFLSFSTTVIYKKLRSKAIKKYQGTSPNIAS